MTLYATRRLVAITAAALLPLTFAAAPSSADTAQAQHLVEVTVLDDADGGPGAPRYVSADVDGRRVWVNTRSAGTDVPAAPSRPAPFTVGGLTADASALIGDRAELYELGVGGASFDQLDDRYGSLTAGLINVQSQTSGQDMQTFLSQQQKTVDAKLPQLGKLQATDVSSLNKQLSLKGVSFTSGQDAAALMRQIDAMPSSPDKAVTQAGTNWAAQVSSVRMPSLTAPRSGPTPAVPDEALLFGLFANKSLTAMAVDHPDMFAQVQSSGLTDPKAQDAWRKSMLNAHQATSQPLSGALADPCSAAFLTAMSTGSSSAARQTGGSDCGSCVAAGLGASSYMTRIFDRGGNTTFYSPGDDDIYPQEYAGMQPWMRGLIAEQDGDGIIPSRGSNDAARGCGAPSAGTDATRTVLPGVFGQLSGR